MKFSTPRNIVFGRGMAKDADKFVEGKALIIAGESSWKSVASYLSLNADVVFVRRRRWKEPCEEDVEALVEELAPYAPRTIIAVGGGSVIDAAKAAWIFYEHPDIDWDSLYSARIPALRRKARFIAIETTSGTGTGVSAAAVIADRQGRKRGVVSGELIPDVAIYDPELAMSMPRAVVIYSGLDALGHAIEAYTSNVNNVIGDTLALKAIELIYTNLEASVKGDKDAREKVHYGNMLAGMGFANSRLHLGHAMAHSLGSRYKIEHGRAVGTVLPYILRLFEGRVPSFAILKDLMGEEPSVAVMKLLRRLGISARLDIPEEDIPSLGEEILNDRLMRFVPIEVEKEEIVKVLYALKEGDIDEV